MAHRRRVLIIGGGPCGLVTLRNLLERGTFDDVQLVERRDNIGGVWYVPLTTNLKNRGDSDNSIGTSPWCRANK